MTKFLKPTVSAWFSLVVMISGASAQEINLSLVQAFEKALAQSPAVEMMRAEERAARSMRAQVQASRLPSLRFQSSYMRGDDPVYVFGSLIRQGRFSENDFLTVNTPSSLTNFSNSLEAGVPLFTAYQITGHSAQADAARSWAKAAEDAAINQIGVQVVESYVDSVLYAHLSEEVSRVLGQAENDIASADRLMKRGLVLGSDYYAARAILEGLRGTLIQLRTNHMDAMARLKLLLGLSLDSDLTLSGRLAETAVPANPSMNPETRGDRPDLRMAEAQVKMAEARRKSDGRSLLPGVSAFGAIETNTNNFEKNPSHHMGGVRLALPFGDPTYMARRDEADHRLESSQKSKAQARLQAEMEIQSLSRGFHGTQSALAHMTESRKMAEQSLSLFRPLYREGRQSVMEVLRAEEALVRARRAELEAVGTLHKLSARLGAASGILTPDAVRVLNESLHPEARP